jgi:soluble lytic murein transglycosylase-like protein
MLIVMLITPTHTLAKQKQHKNKKTKKQKELIHSNEYQKVKKVIQETEEKYDLPQSLLTAVIQHESSFNAKAVNANNYGFGQITYPTARRFCSIKRKRDLFHGHTNINCTAKILRRHIDEYGGVYPALIAYRAGSPCKKYSRAQRVCNTQDKKYIAGVIKKLKTIRKRNKLLASETDDS